MRLKRFLGTWWMMLEGNIWSVGMILKSVECSGAGLCVNSPVAACTLYAAEAREYTVVS